MKQMKKTKRYITLIEMMIVMFLIAMITGVIAYNYTGSLEEGKAFKTKAGIDKIHTVLDLYLATHPEDAENIDTHWKEILKNSQLVKNWQELAKDGWGSDYEVHRGQEGELIIRSKRFEEYKSKKGKGSNFVDNNSKD